MPAKTGIQVTDSASVIPLKNGIQRMMGLDAGFHRHDETLYHLISRL